MRASLSDRTTRRIVEAGFVGLVVGFMLWVRWLPADLFLGPGGVIFPGTDAWYHLRHALYTAANFPATLGFDLFTRYPHGTDTGQYGTIFDVAAAGLGLLLGGSRQDIATAGAILPAILGAATAVPVYLLAKRVWSAVPAAFAAIVLALAPGVFMSRSLVGAFDHHVAETLLSTLFLWGLVRALQRARDLDADLADVLEAPERLRPYAGPWAVAIAALVLYVLTWPPGVLFVAIAATGLGGLALVDHVHGRDARDVQWTGLVVLGGAGLVLLLFVRVPEVRVAEASLLQPLAGLVAGLAVWASVEALAWGRDRDLPRWAMPAAVLVGVPAGLWALGALSPPIGGVLDQGMAWVFGIGRSEALGTISEARPASLRFLGAQHGLLLMTGLAGLVPLGWWTLHDADRGAGVVLAWTVVVVAMGFSQVRFNYYLAVALAGLNGAVMAAAVRIVHLPDVLPPRNEAPEIEWQHVAAVGVVLLLLLPGHVLPTQDYPPAWERADQQRTPSFTRWQGSLEWMRDNTPSEPFTLTTRFERGQAMPSDAYGVLSWWDYGHWITTVGERVPVANPFQQAAPFMADWLTSGTEAGAERMLDERGGTYRYVIIDDQTAAGKWGAIAIWADVPYLDTREQFSLPDAGPVELRVRGSTYNASMMNRLYGEDAFRLGHYRLVHESRQLSLIGSIADVEANRLRRLNRVLDRMDPATARERFGQLTYDTGDSVRPLGQGRYLYQAHLESTIKIFERVEGATIEGTARPGERVGVAVTLQAGTTGRTFSWGAADTADAEGRFAIRVPYATTEPVPVSQGGTEYSVRATGLYTVRAASGNQTTTVVPDQAVRTGGVVKVNLA